MLAFASEGMDGVFVPSVRPTKPLGKALENGGNMLEPS